ncbi:hypothetical protein [Bacillus sp. J37]|uniref:hypothetical protein n=1 Tax=Bacillus sp. J37 TaxID=935837 RepID=UPI0004788FCE|nr:hypothetical protein [Bacillus sp. J37]
MAVKKQLTENEMDKVTKDTASVLKEQEEVTVKLYLNPEERKKLEAAKESGKNVNWPYQVVGINGYNYQIQLGKEVKVPKTVAEILEQAGLY